MREFALKEYGPMSKAVLNEWGIKTTDDIGQIVFNLVNASVLGKNDTDSRTTSRTSSPSTTLSSSRSSAQYRSGGAQDLEHQDDEAHLDRNEKEKGRVPVTGPGGAFFLRRSGGTPLLGAGRIRCGGYR